MAVMIAMPHQLEDARQQHAELEQRIRARRAALLNLEAQKRRLEESRSGYVGNRQRLLESLVAGDERAARKAEVVEREILDCDRRLEAVNLQIAKCRADIDTLGRELSALGQEIARATHAAELDAAAKDLERKVERTRRLIVELAVAYGSVAEAEKEMGMRFGDDGRRRAAPIGMRRIFEWDANSRALEAVQAPSPGPIQVVAMRQAKP